jgi:hypothetical protein
MKGFPVFAIAPGRSLDTAISTGTAISRRNGQKYLHGPPSVIRREPFTVAAHESGRANSIFRKRMAKNCTLVPNRIELGFRYPLSYSVSDLKILEDHGS